MTPDTEMPSRPAPAPPDLPISALVPFMALTFAISWGVLGAYLLAPETMAALFGALSGTHPAFVLAVWAPAIAGVVLVLWQGGPAGLGAFLSRLALWRAPPGWWAFLLLGIPAVFVAGAALKGTLGDGLPAPPAQLLALMAFMLVLGPVEELGWRGVALPLLQRRLAPVWAGALLGAVWGLWHLPAFWLAGTVQSGWNYGAFFVGNVCLSLIVTPLFNAARGSLLLPVLFHWQLINPFWPDAQPWDSWILVAVAAAVLWLHRGTMFARAGAATRVIPAREAPRP